MLREIIPFSRTAESTNSEASGSVCVNDSKSSLQSSGAVSDQSLDHPPEQPNFSAHPCVGAIIEVEKIEGKEYAVSNPGHALFQEMFFFCRVKKVGDVPGTECIYVEAVVDRDSGVAFAKVYPARNAMNAVDILASRVLPYCERHGVAIKEVHTRKTSEYCGLPPRHPFETFLAASHIEHLEIKPSSSPYNYLCEQFYRFLLKEFFPLALRRTFELSLREMQRDLDAFVNDCNSGRMKHVCETEVWFCLAEN